jgi:hypothetical protein
LSSSRYVPLFQKALRINEQLWASEGPWVSSEAASIDELKEAVERAYDVTITIMEVPFEGRHILGLIERYDGGRAVTIYVRYGLPDGQRRLTATKEITHVIIDEEESFNADGHEILEKLCELQLPDEPALHSENDALIVACELLYPYENRRDDVAALAENKVTLAGLSAKYRMPEHLISWVLRPKWLEFCEAIYKAVGQLSAQK